MVNQNIGIIVWNYILRIIVKLIYILTGKGGGKFALLLPPNQKYLINNYCDLYKFNIDTTYPMESSIWLSGVYEVVTSQFLKNIIYPGDVFLDIGANCGALTLVAASKISDGKIYAFEPGDTVRSRLQANIDLNSELKNTVKVVPYGLGLTNSQLFYYEDPNYRGNGCLFSSQGTPVDIISLDDWVVLEKLNKLDVMKVDVEGMEYDVLLGGKSTLEKYHPTIYFETLPIFFDNKSYTIRTIYEFLASLDYQIINPIKPYAQIPFEGNYPSNSVAIHASQLHKLKY